MAAYWHSMVIILMFSMVFHVSHLQEQQQQEDNDIPEGQYQKQEWHIPNNGLPDDNRPHRQRHQKQEHQQQNYSIRLVNSSSKPSGMVEQFVDGKWQSLCGDKYWTNKTAEVICKELNFRRGIVRSPKGTGNHGNYDALSYNCTGKEPYLRNCSRINVSDCSSVAQVTCLKSVQLIGNVKERAAVEIFWKNRRKVMKWGGLCRETWTKKNTRVVCKQFGYRYGEEMSGRIGGISETIWEHTNVSCAGNETDLSDCPQKREKIKKCNNGSRVILKCSPAGRSFNQRCSDDDSCAIGLVCKQLEAKVCRCENETLSFWNIQERACKDRADRGQKCELTMAKNCRDDLVCRLNANGAFCRGKYDDMDTTTVADDKPGLDYNKTCSDDDRCAHGLTCKQLEKKVCRCENETLSFWNIKEKACKDRADLGHSCVLNMHNSCRGDLVCTQEGNGAFCRSKNNGKETTTVADDKPASGYNGTCADDKRCTNGLVCKQDENVCRCENETLSYWNADEEACKERSELNQECIYNISNSCMDALVCTKGANGAVCRIQNDDVGTRKVPDDGTNILLYVGLSIGGLLVTLLTIVVVCCYVRKKRKNTKCRTTVSYNNRSSNNLIVNNGYSEVGPDLSSGNVNGGFEYDLAQPVHHGNDERKCDVNDVTSGPSTQTVATDHYGYGVLGGKRVENDDGGMYSHTRGMNDNGEYDSFVKRHRDSDVNDLYDHNRALVMENEYDEMPERK